MSTHAIGSARSMPPPTAKALIQSLLLAAEGVAYPSRQLVSAGALFGISENSVRVALVRLQSQDMAMSASRGAYQLGPAGVQLGHQVSAWRQIEQRMGPWLAGHYIGVHTGAMARSDRVMLKQNSRALSMMGFREVSKGLHMRPDNLLGGVTAVRHRLQTLGLAPQARVFAMAEACTELEAELASLWQGPALNQAYRQTQQLLSNWLSSMPTLEPAQAAREAYLLDRQAIRQVVWDPLLPDVMVDAKARAECFATVRDFDAAGRSIWWRFFEFSEQS